ncbi:MAG: hypothetical protein U0441_17060 [Polyangiaceae bacterium]
MRFAKFLLPISITLLSACSGESGTSSDTTTTTTTTTTATTSSQSIPDQCDALVPTACALPFPSSRYLVDDPKTVTGKHLFFPASSLPNMQNGKPMPGDGFTQMDGFSPGLAPFTHMPGATITGLPDPDHIEQSLADDCPTVLLDTSTGQRVPHWAELDMSGDDDERRVLYVRPVVRLKDDTRYIVAIRRIVDKDGKALPASPAFAALRDGTGFDHPSIDARRALYEDIFGQLKTAGIDKTELQIAWDYTTASKENLTGPAVKMRDDALAKVGAVGPDYVIDSVMDAPDDGIARRIEGHMTVPLYLTKADPDPDARLVLGDDGLPVQNGTADYPFTVIIPDACAQGTPCPLLQYGHGLLGGRGEVGGGSVHDFITKYGYVAFATDWIGMAGDDSSTLSNIVAAGDISKFAETPERSMQGFTNAILAMRMMSGGFVQDPEAQFNGKPAIDPSQRYYDGNSQGGILGAALMTLHVDVTRGVLGVPGMPYNLLLHRSQDFGTFFFLLKNTFPDPVDQNIVLGLVQTLWDRGEPDGYAPYMRGENRLPNTPDKDVLLHVAIGDHQVSPLGAHVLARAVGAKSMKPAVRPIFGVEEAEMPYQGSAIVEFDFGLPPAPITNTPMLEGDDPHGKVRKLPEAEAQMDAFLRTGQVVATCNGPCVFK